MNWKKAQNEGQKLANLQFDRNYVNKVYEEDRETSYLDFFYSQKVNKSLHNYKRNLVKNQWTFDDYCKSNSIVKHQADRTEMSKQIKDKYNSLWAMESGWLAHSRSVGRPVQKTAVENVSLAPLGNSLNPFGKVAQVGKKVLC